MRTDPEVLGRRLVPEEGEYITISPKSTRRRNVGLNGVTLDARTSYIEISSYV